MKRTFPLLAALVALLTLTLSGCLTTPVGQSGGVGSLTVQNSNPYAIITAASDIFPRYGYSLGEANYPNSISFDKPAGAFGNLMYGSYGVTTTMRATVVITPIPGSNDYRLSTRVQRVSDAGQAGFEDSTNMMGLWSGEFKPLLRQIAQQAGGAGPM